MARPDPGALGALGLTCVGLYCAARALIAWLGETRSFAQIMTPVLVVGVAVLVGFFVLIARVSRDSRTMRVNIDPGGTPREAVDHEVGHALVGLSEGGRVVAALVNPDGSGWCDVRLPAGATVEQRVAVSLGGAVGEGVSFNSPQCRGDHGHVQGYLNGVPRDDHDRVMTGARRRASAGVHRLWTPGQAAAMRRALIENGRYR